MEDKNFKIGDWVYFKYGERYAIGTIDIINESNNVKFIGTIRDNIPKNKKEFDKLKKYFLPNFIDNVNTNELHTIQFKNEENKQQVYDDLENKDFKIGDYIYNKNSANDFHIGKNN